MILNESKRDELLLPYLNIYKEKTGQNVPLGKFKEMMLYKLGVQGGLQNLSQSSNYYLVGATKYYFNGDLTTNNDLSIFHEDFNDDDSWNREVNVRLNACINVLRNAYIDSVGTEFEQPEDFGTLSLPRLLRKYNKKINAELGIEEEPKAKKKKEGEEEPIDFNVGNGYTFDILYSYNDATKYNVWTQPGAWCITYGSSHYNGYIRRLGIHYVIFLKNGYQEIKRPTTPGPGFTQEKPHDEYGNSMIAVLQSNDSWQPVYITSRWNHGAGNVYCQADHAYTTEEFCQITGVTPEDLERIYKIWQRERGKRRPARQRTTESPEAKARALAELRRIKYAQMRINGGENANTLFNVEGVLYGREGAENPETGEVLYDFKNSVYVCSLKNTGNEEEEENDDDWDNNTKTMFLVDKGKTVFETICKLARPWWGDIGFVTAEKYYGRKNPEDKYKMHNIVMYKKLENGPWLLYDTRRHDFVDVGGVKRFKYLPLEWGSNNTMDAEAKFYIVKLTSVKMALIKISNNLPLRLPNGEFWFSNLKCNSNGGWSRYVNGKFVGTKQDAFLQITIDDEANDSHNTYFYSVPRNSFFDIPNFNSISTDFEGCQVDMFQTITLHGKTYNVVKYFNNRHLSYNGVRCIIDDSANLVKLGGFTLFKNIYSPGNKEKFLFLEPDLKYFKDFPNGYNPNDSKGTSVMYNTETDSFLSINGKILQGCNSRGYGRDCFALCFRSDGETGNGGRNLEYLFREEPLEFLKNPVKFPSEFAFDVSTYDSYPETVLIVFNQPNPQGVTWYTGGERERQIYDRITTRIPLKDLHGIRLDEQPSTQINESYIRQMVSEALKKLMNNGK